MDYFLNINYLINFAEVTNFNSGNVTLTANIENTNQMVTAHEATIVAAEAKSANIARDANALKA